MVDIQPKRFVLLPWTADFRAFQDIVLILAVLVTWYSRYQTLFPQRNPEPFL